MKTKTVLIISIFVVMVLALVALGFVIGINRSKDGKGTTTVTSTTILNKITDQYFIVTKTVIVDQESKITVDQGSEWDNFLWGQSIDAEGLIRVDIGVDVSSLTEEDIEIDNKNRIVKIKIPQATILDASQFGDLEVKTKSGILKFLLENDPNENHNEALKQLISDATIAVEQDSKVFEEAHLDSVNLIKVIIEELGYKLEIE